MVGQWSVISLSRDRGVMIEQIVRLYITGSQPTCVATVPSAIWEFPPEREHGQGVVAERNGVRPGKLLPLRLLEEDPSTPEVMVRCRLLRVVRRGGDDALGS